MKYLILIFVIVSLSSCVIESDIPLDRTLQSVDITRSDGERVGKGVILPDGRVMTVYHVYSICSPECLVKHGSDTLPINEHLSLQDRDITLLGSSDSLLPVLQPVIVGERVMLSRNGLIHKGTITSLSGSYHGYTTDRLDLMDVTGALVLDIMISPGESGTPVWTLSGELVGLLSAADRERGVSYIVRP